MVDKDKKKYSIDSDNIEKYLGIKKYLYNDNKDTERIGIVNGMAYTIYGGDILPIETAMFKGKEELILTGSLGEVMQESAQIAFDYIKANSDKFGVNLDKLENKSIHIHVPEEQFKRKDHRQE